MTITQHKLLRGPVLLEGIHSSGRSIGQIGNKNIYFEKGIPGESVIFTMGRRKRGFNEGFIEEISIPSPHRKFPFCKHHDTCGGCSWQHIDYPRQLELKHSILTNALGKYGVITPEVPAVLPSPEIMFYRHRMEYAFSASVYSKKDGHSQPSPVLGFHFAGEPGKVAAVQECFMQEDPSRSICEFTEAYAKERRMEFYDAETKSGFLRSLSIRINQQGEVLVLLGLVRDIPSLRDDLLGALSGNFPQIVALNYTVHLSSAHSQLQGEIIPFGTSLPFLYETLAGFRFRIHASSFFQPNVQQAEQIFKTARNWARLAGHEKVYDLYTGVGTLAHFLAPEARVITGIEGSPQAIEDAKENAGMNGLRNTEFMVGDILETFKPPFLDMHGKPDLIVLDPPRSGTLIEIKKTINTSGAEKVIYLSCNPVSLAFDLKQLNECYRVIRIQPYDMLPQTHHLETLVLLEHK
jgi:23S rRNA (uracil1939-C5)-methyltransferase